ncbi:MAG: glycosyltransferase family 39 protein, partial [Candidatus Levyibacteriota bacterium]
ILQAVKKFLFLLILALGFLLRAQETLSGNYLFLLDQGRDMMAVKSIVYDHHLTLIGPHTSLGGVFQGPFWYYLLAVATFLTGGNPWGGVFLSLLISMGTIVVAFLFARKLFGLRVAFITAFLLAICPEAAAAATYAWNPHPMWLLLTIYTFSFYLLVQGKKKYHFVVWPTVALMFSFQTALGTFIFLSSIIYLILSARKQLKTKEFLFGLMSFLILLSPQILFDFRHDFLMSKGVIAMFSGSRQGTGFLSHVVTTFTDHFYNFHVNFNSAFNGLIFSGVAFYLLLFSILFGRLTKFLSDKEYKFVILSAKLVLTVFSFSLLYQSPLRAWFLTGFEVMFIFPLGIILAKFWERSFGKVLLTILLLITLWVIIPRIYNLYRSPDYGGIAKVKGKLDAIDYIYKDAKGGEFNMMVFAPAVYTDPYDYLVWWRSENVYRYAPGKEKEGTFYLLIEPDSSKPWTYKGWLETVVKSGEIIFTTELPSGLIVQKRSH